MDIYVEVVREPETKILETRDGTFLGKIGFYVAMYNGEEIVVQGVGSFVDTLPSVGSKGIISGKFEEQRFYDDNYKKLEMPYFFVGDGVME